MTADSQVVDPTGASDFVGAAEAHAGRPFRCRGEITLLLAFCRSRGSQQLFDDLAFNAKFITGAMQVLRRVGADSADAAKMAAELRDMMEKTTTLLRTIVKEMPAGDRQGILDRFLAPTQDSMGELALLLGELARVKNYMLDRR